MCLDFCLGFVVPKSITSILDPDRRRKRKKRRKRKVDYTELLKPPVVTDARCPHTKRVQDMAQCSQCLLIQPSIVHKPDTVDWWLADENDIDDLELDLDVNIDIDSIPDDEV